MASEIDRLESKIAHLEDELDKSRTERERDLERDHAATLESLRRCNTYAAHLERELHARGGPPPRIADLVEAQHGELVMPHRPPFSPKPPVNDTIESLHTDQGLAVERVRFDPPIGDPRRPPGPAAVLDDPRLNWPNEPLSVVAPDVPYPTYARAAVTIGPQYDTIDAELAFFGPQDGELRECPVPRIPVKLRTREDGFDLLELVSTTSEPAAVACTVTDVVVFVNGEAVTPPLDIRHYFGNGTRLGGAIMLKFDAGKFVMVSK